MSIQLCDGKVTLKSRLVSFNYRVRRNVSDFINRSKFAMKNKDIHYFLYDGQLLRAYVEIQKYKKYRGNLPKLERNYIDACLRNAFKCFKVFCGAHHSGLSASVTFDILKDLYDGKPFTPITEEDTFSFAFERRPNIKSYQCARYGALFRDDTPHGSEYTDNNRTITIEKNTGNSFHNGAVSNYIDNLDPIRLPYIPVKAEYKVYIDYYIFKEPEDSNHDFEAIHMLYYIKKGEDVKKDIDLYITYDEEHDKVLTLTPIEWEANYAGRYRKV